MRLVLIALFAAALVVPPALARPDESARIARIVDGDTIALTSGERVRLLQVDTPEVGSGECYSRAAARELGRLLPLGTAVGLEADVRLDRVDRYGRLLRYVRVGGRNVNLELVQRGAATVYLYRGERGRYAGALVAAAQDARAAKRGIWGACRVAWDPTGPATTSPKTAPSPSGCDPSYPDFCIPSPPPDLDCADIPRKGFRVVGGDPHRFDGDGDRVGCE